MAVKEAADAVVMIYGVYTFLQDVYAKVDQIGGKAADMVGRLLVFGTLIEQLESNRKAGTLDKKGGLIEKKGQLQALKRLKNAVLEAKK